MVQTQLREREEQIDAGLLTDSYYPSRRMMMGIICSATQLCGGSWLQATQVTHFLIFHSGPHERWKLWKQPNPTSSVLSWCDLFQIRKCWILMRKGIIKNNTGVSVMVINPSSHVVVLLRLDSFSASVMLANTGISTAIYISFFCLFSNNTHSASYITSSDVSEYSNCTRKSKYYSRASWDVGVLSNCAISL